MVNMPHNSYDRRPRDKVFLGFFLVKVNIELLQEGLILFFGRHYLDIPADLLPKDLEGRFVKGLRSCSHFPQMEQDGDQ